MSRFGHCEGCDTWKHIYVSVVVMVSSLGSRIERRQKSTTAMKLCRTCFHSKKLAFGLLPLVREAAKAVAREAREGSLV